MQAIIRKIVELDLAGHNLLEENVQTSNELLHPAAVSEFGLWVSPDHIKRQLWRLYTAANDLGGKVNRSRDHAFYNAAVRQFGSWREALTVAGVNPVNVTHRKPKNFHR